MLAFKKTTETTSPGGVPLPVPVTSPSATTSNSNLKLFYIIGLILAFLLYGTLDISIHTSSIISHGPTIILEVNLKKPKSLELLLNEYNYNYSNGDLDEESIVDDPLTDLLINDEVHSLVPKSDGNGNFGDDDGEVDDSEAAADAIKDMQDDLETIREHEKYQKMVNLRGKDVSGLSLDLKGESTVDGSEFELDESGSLSVIEMRMKRVQAEIDAYRGPIRVALYVGPGTTTNARNNVPYILEKCSEDKILVQRIEDASLSDVGRLRTDVIFIPGGSAGRIYAEMSTESKKKNKLGPQMKIRKFLEKGGGYVGVCAGAYLAAGGKSGRSPLKISMFKTEAGGLGDGYISGTAIDETAKKWINTVNDKLDDKLLTDSQLFYANGPIFKNATSKEEMFASLLSDPKVILRIGNDAYIRILVGGGNGKQTHRRLSGLPILVMNNFGKGKVVLSTAHPETDVTGVSYNTWKKAHIPSKCDSQEAQELLTMVYLAANRTPDSIEF